MLSPGKENIPERFLSLPTWTMTSVYQEFRPFDTKTGLAESRSFIEAH
jgi:hypothetical protein